MKHITATILLSLLSIAGTPAMARDINIAAIDPDTGEADQWIELRFIANPKGVALWATQHCTECRVLKPDHLVETVMNNLKKGLDLY